MDWKARLPCHSLSPWVCSNSCPLSQWCRSTISSSVARFSSCPQSFLALGFFFPMIQFFSSSILQSIIQYFASKYWSFGFITRPYNEYSALISFMTDWFDLAVQGTSPAPQFESISSLVLSLLYSSTLTSVCDYWKDHSFDYEDLCQQSGVSAF